MVARAYDWWRPRRRWRAYDRCHVTAVKSVEMTYALLLLLLLLLLLAAAATAAAAEVARV